MTQLDDDKIEKIKAEARHDALVDKNQVDLLSAVEKIWTAVANQGKEINDLQKEISRFKIMVSVIGGILVVVAPVIVQFVLSKLIG